MKQFLLTCIFLLTACGLVQAGTLIEMQTSAGTITLELADEKAPVSVENFLEYVDQNFFDGTIFHRVIGDFMIQGGGFDQTLKRKETMGPIKNEAGNNLKNNKGTIAMARTNVVDSATSQFFINLVDNNFLNNRGKSSSTYGYAVFGQVIKGMDVVEKIGKARTFAKSPLFQNFPEPQIIIESVRRVKKIAAEK